METLVDILLALTFLVIGLLGALLVAVGLPGVWLVVAVAVIAELIFPGSLGWWAIGAGVLSAVIGEIGEFVAGAAGAKAAGGSRSAALAAIFGGLAGAILGTVYLIILPVIGTIIGAVVGAGLAAALVERGVKGRTWSESSRVGRGAAAGRLWAIVIKGGIAIALGGALAVKALFFPPA